MSKEYVACLTALVISFFPVAHASAFDMRAPSYGYDSAVSSPLLKTISDTNVQKGAESFVNDLVQEGIAFLSNKNLTVEQRKQEFDQLLSNNFAIKTIAKFSIGRYWRSATESQRDEYFNLFKNMIVNVYSKRFGDYQGQNISVTGSRPDGKRDTIVYSVLQPSDGPNISVDWRIRHKAGKFLVVDVIVEGVSMSLTQRSDFASVIQRGGGNVDVLLAHLR